MTRRIRLDVRVASALIGSTAAVLLLAGCSHRTSAAYPSPRHTPGDVVRFQVQALASERDGAGIAVAYRFASPRNKLLTGPLEQFARIVGTPAYRPMLRHQVAEYSEVVADRGRAAQLVRITARDGSRHVYLFELSRQTGGSLPGCWLTDSVRRIESGESERVEV